MPKIRMMQEKKVIAEEPAWKATDWVYSAINIGPHQRRRRLITGIVCLVMAIAGLSTLAVFGVNRWWRLFLFIPYWAAAIGMLQAHEKTCVRLAARGVCNLDDGEETIVDSNLVGILREQAKRIYAWSFGIASLATIAGLVLP